MLRDRVHDRGRQRGYADRHAQAENRDRRKKICPVAPADSRQDEKRKTQRGDQRADNERKLCSITYDQSAGPTRKKRNDQDEGQERRARRGGRVVLHLNQIERQEKQSSAKRSVEQKRQQVRASEYAGAKKREWQHRLGNFLFY